jgi:hypothetical protein
VLRIDSLLCWEKVTLPEACGEDGLACGDVLMKVSSKDSIRVPESNGYKPVVAQLEPLENGLSGKGDGIPIEKFIVESWETPDYQR